MNVERKIQLCSITLYRIYVVLPLLINYIYNSVYVVQEIQFKKTNCVPVNKRRKIFSLFELQTQKVVVCQKHEILWELVLWKCFFALIAMEIITLKKIRKQNKVE